MMMMFIAAVAAGGAAMLGALLARWRQPSTLVSSVMLGFAAGVMTGTVAFELLPEALRLASLWVVAFGFAAGFGLVYGLDLVVHRGKVAGERAEQRGAVEAAYQRKRPFGGPAMVLAGGTLFEAAVEGVSLGVGTAIGAGLTIPLAIAVAIDNLSEGLSLGSLPDGDGGEAASGKVLPWTAWIAATTVIAALAGWFVLRSLSPAVHAAVFAAGGGGMLYLTVTELVPVAEAEHYQQSSALATACGFLLILILSEMQ
jgi:ZIP family zinc transporter